MCGTVEREHAVVISRTADAKIVRAADDSVVGCWHGRRVTRPQEESTMKDKLFGSIGIGSTALTLGGALLAMAAGKTHELMVDTPAATMARDLAKPASTATWIGAYAELIGCVIFLCFAVWACTKLGSGIWSTIGIAAATAYTALTVASLALMDAVSYRAGKGIDLGVARSLVTLNEALYVTTWFLAALFLVSASVLAVGAGRRVLGWTAGGIAAFTLVAAPAFNGVGQASNMLFLAWIVGASIALMRREPRHAVVPVTA
jgi:hypothetical protein